MTEDKPTTVQLFVTCVVDALFPSVGRAVIDVLEQKALAVEFPTDQACCGQPALNAGHRSEARALAAHTVGVLDQTEGTILIPSGSCAAMIIDHYPYLFADDPEMLAAAERVASRVREFTQFLVDDVGLGGLATGTDESVTFHPSCHGLRHLGLFGYGERVLDEVDVDRRDLEGAEECCGFGGLFSVEMPEVSGAIMDTKLDNVEATGARVLVGYDASCLLHLAGGLHRRGSAIEVKHVAELLASRDGE